jgi:hypothetical protein
LGAEINGRQAYAGPRLLRLAFSSSEVNGLKKVAILQSNYIPWKGYFDLIAAVDEFIIYDDMQFTKNDWRNRNKIKTTRGIQWLTVPVGSCIHRRIREVSIDTAWQVKHWKSLSQSYARANCFAETASWLEPLYLHEKHENLSAMNRRFIEEICSKLGIKTTITNSWDYALISGKTERLVDLCLQAGGTEYISGPSARCYLDQSVFESSGIKLTWFDYSGYREYPQLWGSFVHEVTILDLIFNCGAKSPSYMKFG